MEINRSNINDIVNNSNARPDKDYGQNFLVEPEVCKRIVNSASLTKDENVLEIGPGLGSLTHFISQLSDHLTVVDIDERMIAFLNLIYKDSVNIVQDDIRNHDVSSYQKIIGNLPYNITSETIVYLIMNAVNAKKIVLMIQSDAYPHFSDVQGKEYGPSSVLLHLLGESKKLFQVKAGSFYPVPKCGSTVFEINIANKCELEEAKQVYALAKKLFLNRRKTIANNLQAVVQNKELVNQILDNSNILPTKRPEEISPLNYLNLYRVFKTLYYKSNIE